MRCGWALMGIALIVVVCVISAIINYIRGWFREQDRD